MAQVTAKSGANGYVLGVNFVNGRADTEAPAALAFFRSSEDYSVSEPTGKAAKAAAADADK